MEEFTDYIEFDRPEGKAVRVVFELYRYEILFHFCEFRHNEKSEWQSMKKADDGYHYYNLPDNNRELRVKFPTPIELSQAIDTINKKYNILSV